MVSKTPRDGKSPLPFSPSEVYHMLLRIPNVKGETYKILFFYEKLLSQLSLGIWSLAAMLNMYFAQIQHIFF